MALSSEAGVSRNTADNGGAAASGATPGSPSLSLLVVVEAHWQLGNWTNGDRDAAFNVKLMFGRQGVQLQHDCWVMVGPYDHLPVTYDDKALSVARLA